MRLWRCLEDPTHRHGGYVLVFQPTSGNHSFNLAVISSEVSCHFFCPFNVNFDQRVCKRFLVYLVPLIIKIKTNYGFEIVIVAKEAKSAWTNFELFIARIYCYLLYVQLICIFSAGLRPSSGTYMVNLTMRHLNFNWPKLNKKTC